MRKILVLAVLLGGAAAVSAQQSAATDATDSRFEDVVIVTASLEEQEAERVTASVDVIDEREIAARQATSVADLLRTVPGLTVVQSGSAGKLTSLFSRGTESDHTLALWNGIELNNPYFGGFDWAFLPTDGVRKVEVVRGPFSAVHGSDALGGVVQVLTGGRTGGAVRLEAGDRGYGRLALDAGVATTELDLSLAGHLRRGDGQFENDFFDSQDLAVNARWMVSGALAVSLVARAHDSDNGVPFSAGVPSPEREIAWRERQVAVPVAYQRGSWEVSARASRVAYTTTFRDPEDAFGFTGYDTDSESERLQVSGVRRYAEGSWLAFGGEIEQLVVDDRSVFGTNLDGASQKTQSLFAQAAHELGPLRVEIGGRYDDNDVFGSRTTPKVGLRLALGESTRLRASWGEGFRAPSIGELFYPFSGNADLEPEESESWELGFEHQVGHWTLGAAAFDNQFLNLVDFDFVTFSNRNVGRANSRGVELWGRYAGRRLSASATITALETEDLETGLSLLRRPDESASLTLIATPPRWNLSFTATYVGQRADIDAVSFERTELGSHLRMDVAARFEQWRSLQPYARLENVADEAYQDVAGYPAPGRRLVGGLALSWR